MKLSVENLAQHLPRYLSAERLDGIKKGLADFPNIAFWYVNAYDSEVLQGDCWAGLTALHFDDGTRKKIRGVVISNSCSIDPGNTPRTPQQIVFVPLLKVETLKALFERHGHAEATITSELAAIRRQEVDSFVYYPASARLGEESVAWLDQVHTMPVKTFLADDSRAKLGTLGDTSFYLFAFKLSIYFCRLHENVDRSEAVHQA